ARVRRIVVRELTGLAALALLVMAGADQFFLRARVRLRERRDEVAAVGLAAVRRELRDEPVELVALAGLLHVLAGAADVLVVRDLHARHADLRLRDVLVGRRRRRG